MIPILLYRQRRTAANGNKNATAPVVINKRLDALRALANSILNEIVFLEQDRDTMNDADFDLAAEMQRFETNIIKCALARTGGRQRQAARLLRINPSTLNSKMKRYGMLLSDRHDNCPGMFRKARRETTS